MDSSSRNELDCKISLRKYVLITEPSRWAQKGRVVVQSPMLELGPSISDVPVKCCNGKGRNDVGFLPKSEIEKDTNDVYEKSYVSKIASDDYAHGVAAFDSDVSDGFKYKRGHRFWIFIGPNRSNYKHIVPVINLDTCEGGIIRIDQVRWFPKVRGPSGELWTLGGSVRELKLPGSKKYSYWSWVICQYLDGRPAITKEVAIPTKDHALTDRSLLSIQESQTLFHAQCKVMEETAAAFRPLTPSATPPPDIAAVLSDTAKLWGRINQAAHERCKLRGASYLLRTSTISTKVPSLQKQHEAIRATIGVQSNWEETYGNLNNYSLWQPIPRTASLSPQFSPDAQARSDQADTLKAVIKLMDISWNESKDLTSLTNPSVPRDPDAAIREYYKDRKLEYKARDNLLLADLCDINIQRCPYTMKSSRKHFHSPREKCQRTDPTHECCVSDFGPFPHPSHCLLAASPSSHRDHICCKWSDQRGITIKVREGVNSKVREARKRKLELIDMSSTVSYQQIPDDYLSDDEMGEGALDLKATLEQGYLDEHMMFRSTHETTSMDGHEDCPMVMDGMDGLC